MEEQLRTNAYNLEYRDLVWGITLKHTGSAMFPEDLESVLQHHLNEEQFRLEKELLALQQRYDDELGQARSAPADIERRPRVSRVLDPKRMAFVIWQRLQDFDDPEAANSSAAVIDGLIKIVRRERRRLESGRGAAVPSPRKPSPKPRPVPLPLPMPPAESEPDIGKIEDHIAARKKLKKSVAKADKFVRELQRQPWFEGMFPHME
jgi:hypothetical protein